MLRNLPSAVFLVVRSLIRIFPGLGPVLNRFAINLAVEKLPNRPHPWSTVHDYVSWSSLSDQHHSARHLPAFHPTYTLPDAESVAALFKRPDKQQLCTKSTCLFPAFAQYLTDGFIRTRMPNTSAGEPELSADAKKVAVKLFKEEYTHSELLAEAFRRECQALRDLDHPNIVTLFDSGKDSQTGRHFLVLEWLDHDLSEWLTANPFAGWDDYYRDFGRPLLDALAFAHTRQITIGHASY